MCWKWKRYRRYKKVHFSPEKYRYLEWTEGRSDNDEKAKSTERKIGQI